MDKPDREVEPYFTKPYRQVSLTVITLALVVFGAYVAFPRVAPVFLANPFLNGFIAIVFVFGIFACFYQIFQLFSSVNWIVGFAGGRPGHEDDRAPVLLAPLAALLRSRGAKMQISSGSTRSILDSVATRIEEMRDITRYLVNLLIFLGLLGTFYGLATTVPAVVETIRSLAPKDGETSVDIFTRLMSGLEAQLGGMGVAFSSSLLGLAGSLVVGLLELFASHGQNRFYRELEEWLSSITKLGFAMEGEGGEALNTSAGLVAHMVEQMGALQDIVISSESGRSEIEVKLGRLADSVERLADRIDTSTSTALSRVADGQDRLVALLEARESDGGTGVDAESRMRLRSIDVQLLRVLEELSAGRQESLASLRSDLSVLIKAVREQAKNAPAKRS